MLSIPFSYPVHGHVTELGGGTYLGHKTMSLFWRVARIQEKNRDLGR